MTDMLTPKTHRYTVTSPAAHQDESAVCCCHALLYVLHVHLPSGGVRCQGEADGLVQHNHELREGEAVVITPRQPVPALAFRVIAEKSKKYHGSNPKQC